jgi:Zn-dependent peptidase ImmA (M78 family)/DNA-binding Xre family transcriptional regulator
MRQAYIDGMEGQLEILNQEIREFESLSRGEFDTLQLGRLENLPLGLIKARIARGLSHKELAAILHVKPQQVQRWEHEEYENVGFSKLVEIAKALEIQIDEQIHIPSKKGGPLGRLRSIGIDRHFFTTRIVPVQAWESGEVAEHLAAAASRLQRIFGIELLPDGTIVQDPQFAGAHCYTRFKLPSNAESNRVRAYSIYVSYLAEVIARSTADQDQRISSTWREMREALFASEKVTYEQALRRAWDLGIPVLPLSDPIRLHGCCIRTRGINVIVLKQSARLSSRWLFDLVHELYHASEEPRLQAFGAIDGDATDDNRRMAESEQAANEFAGNVLLNGRAATLFSRVLSLADLKVQRIKGAVARVSEAEAEDVGVLANYCAYRLKNDHFIDWWGTAMNLQKDEVDAFELTKDVFLERFPLNDLSADDRALLEQALSDPPLR